MVPPPLTLPKNEGGDRPSAFSAWKIVATIVGLLLLVVMFNNLPSLEPSREAARRAQCRINLQQIAQALYAYHDEYHAFPPAYTVDEVGRPLHGWRTLLLPFFPEQPGERVTLSELYQQIDLKKPWDDPANARAYATPVTAYRCWSATAPETFTVYVSARGPGTVFESSASRKLSELKGDHSQTLMVVEVPSDQAVHWMSPLEPDAKSVLNSRQTSKPHHAGGEHVLFLNDRVEQLSY